MKVILTLIVHTISVSTSIGLILTLSNTLTIYSNRSKFLTNTQSSWAKKSRRLTTRLRNRNRSVDLTDQLLWSASAQDKLLLFMR